ncbi:MAG: adenosylcobinamide-GDP ribazoletransferase [Candidatus Omnitrophota bacterium]|jgi:adenosylcobinamide-GDP ribazoletransferase
MTSLLLALQFLTIVPIKIKAFTEARFARSMMFFPVIGLLIAFFLAVINSLFLSLGFNGIILNVILVVTLIILTGGMHLDGLSDTFDAIASAKSKEKMLEIMRDSHCGVMGILSIICVILLKISFLSSMSSAHKIGAIILMCVFSRWSLVFLTFLFPYVREQGKGKIFSQGINLKIVMITTIFSLICAIVVFKIAGFLIFVPAALIAYLFGRLVSKKINGITGDVLGSTNELVEVTVLLTVCILERMGLLWII